MLKLDTRNARIHSNKSKYAIKKSLKELGAGRSILLDKEDVAIGGNGVLEQAEALGIPIKIIETDGSELIAVKRVDLATDDPKRKALAIADNRIGELSAFDDKRLGELLSECHGMQLPTGFSHDEILELIAEREGKSSASSKPEVEFAEELLECHNYIVLYFDTDVDWLQALTLFNLKTVKDIDSLPHYEHRGVGRVIKGAVALNRLLGAKR